jgi:hypothetical protein
MRRFIGFQRAVGYGYHQRKHERLLFMVTNAKIDELFEEPIYLTLKEMRSWVAEYDGKRFRRFMANCGSVKAIATETK